MEVKSGGVKDFSPYPEYEQELREYLEMLYLIKQDRGPQNQPFDSSAEDPKFGGR